ncbi:thioester reductase domain-containing protein [Cyanobium sp. HWJ4-Hawea]|uniref:type I polyketide synthase n=1 Tax=Cyanobium sp. HWJ4-Hawea TaxID=2823713 RepID=UPI0020CF2276|nr:type I polyketide synthase [Cyanobium sp. HWJ4-Hawea]MCP9807970.1 thioester reductase domain-containing protein [Cyanobium sp. HWJ4-Hawea]
MPDPIAIVGIGCRLPGGINSAREFWDFLREGREAIKEVPPDRWNLDLHYNPDPEHPLTQHVRRGGFVEDIDQFDPAFFGITPREAVCMDPQQRLLMEVAWRALEDAGQPLEQVRGTAIGVFMGISSADYSSLLWASREGFATPDNEPFVLPGNTGCIAANRLSYFFDLKGPSFTVDTACSSSLVAVHLACESIWRGESVAALAGGAQALIHPGIQMSFCKAGLLAPDGRCKSFDASADGYVRSEGAGAVLLKPLAMALAAGDPVYAVIHGSAVNSDGRSNGMVAPNARAQIACVRAAFARAGIDPAATQYVEAHGTGTRQGDPIELRALGTVLGEGRPEGETCRVGSVKTNLGHSETAAGITGLIKAALCIAKRQLPQSLNCRQPNPAIDFAALKLQVQTSLEPFPHPDRAAVVGVSSFGFGGTNAHVVLSDAPPQLAPMRFGARMPLQLITLSARTPEALAQMALDLTAQLRAKPSLKLADLATSANRGRTAFRQRAVCIAKDIDQLLGQLQALAADRRPLPEGLSRSTASRRPGKLAWLFTGQGSQALGMGAELLNHPIFREAFEQVSALLDPQLERPLRDLLTPPAGDEARIATQLNKTGATQPALFAIGYALSQLWQSWGIQPDLLMGHSIGEVLAAHLAGVFSLEDGCRLVAARGRLMQALPADGGMAALLAPLEQVQSLLSRHPEVQVAAYNGPANTVVSAPTSALRQLLREAETAGLTARQLAVSHAFHTKAMAPMLEAFECELSQLTFSPPQKPLVSNLTGLLAGIEMAQPEYWCDQVISPVLFAEGIETLVIQGAQVFMEIGARPTLIGMARQCRQDPSLSHIPSLVPGQPDWEVMFTGLAGLWRRGFSVDWEGFHRPFPDRRISLPGYPFERQRYWWSRRGEGQSPASFWLDHLEITGPQSLQQVPDSAARAEVFTRLDFPSESNDLRVYQTVLANSGSDLADHRIRGQVVFPAAGFITAALAVLEQAGQPLTLGAMRLDQPLKLDGDATTVKLQCHWCADGLAFHSRQESAQSSAWQRHGEVEVPAAASIGLHPFSPSPVPNSALAVGLGGLYEALTQVGLAYGPTFRGLQELKVERTEAWAELQRPKGGLDRGLLDSCFQAVAVLLDPATREGQLLLPVGFEDLWLAALPLPDRLHCQVRLQPIQEPAFVVADLLLHNGSTPLGWIRGFRLRRLPRQALEWLFPQPIEPLPPGPHDWLLDAQWQEAPDFAYPAEQTGAEKLLNGSEPLLLWPDLSASDSSLEELAAALLVQAQQLKGGPSRAVWLVLKGGGPLAAGLAAFARSAALEQPEMGWTVLHLADGAEPAEADWPALWALGEREPILLWRDGLPWVQRLKPLADSPFRLESASLGSLETLHAVPLRRKGPGPGELELAVEATGLNFRDVLNALGLLAGYSRELGLDADARMPYGGECVGQVVAVGAGVDGALVGQRMLAALAVGSLASHVVCRAALCVPLPQNLDPVVGASVSTAFLTAIYGLSTLARLEPGETVLIHAAAGGVGQAALQVAQRCGARILATASAAKQPGLLEQGVEAVFDSRSLDFAEQVRTATGGKGVDVVLNSLKGDWVEASFAALANGGRFVELGKIETWSRQEAEQRRPDASYLPFDLLEVAAADPALVRGLLLELLTDLEESRYAPIPVQMFPIERSTEAFRLMAQARHVGKVVISQPERSAPWSIRPEATYLVTGAFGGIGQQLCQWLANQGARSLVLLGRHPNHRLGEQLQARGVYCKLVEIDLAGDCSDQLAEVLRSHPVNGVFHAAGLLDDGLLEAQTPERQAAVLAPKWGGWQRLEQACRLAGCQPEFGVTFSSMASLLGSPSQTSYATANGALDGLAMAGSAWPLLSIQWGPWGGAGMAAGLERRFAALGVGLLSPDHAFEALALLMERGQPGCCAVLNNDWPRLASQLGTRQASVLQDLLESAPTYSPEGAEANRLRQKLATADSDQRHLLVVELLQQRLATVMGLEDASSLDPGDSLFHVGLDSLMAVELAAGIQRDLGVKLELESLAGDPTVEALAVVLLEALEDPDAASERVLDLGKEARLPSTWSLPAPATAAENAPDISDAPIAPGGAILLTGASGFLGAYLLAGQLQRWDDLQVRCLVRASDSASGLARIRANLDQYGLWQDSWSNRLSAVPGDLAQPRFGLSESDFADLARDLGGILHNGAQLSQMAPYSQLEAANVGGTQTVLDLAVHPAAKGALPLQLISSVATFEAAAYRNRVMLESDDVAEWRGIHVGYSQTKWVSERLVLEAGAAGLPVTVYRPPLIGGHSQTGAWHQDDLLHRLLRGCLALGMAPDLPWELDLVPVDYVADAVTALAWMPEAVGRNFHLQHPQPMLLADLLGSLIARGAPLELGSMDRWLEAIGDDHANPLYGIRAFFVRRWGEEQLTYPELNQAGVRARPSCQATVELLGTKGIQCPGFEQLIGPYSLSLITGIAAS